MVDLTYQLALTGSSAPESAQPPGRWRALTRCAGHRASRHRSCAPRRRSPGRWSLGGPAQSSSPVSGGARHGGHREASGAAPFAPKVGEDRLEHDRVLDAGNDPHCPTAGRTGLDGNAEHPFQSFESGRRMSVSRCSHALDGCQSPGSLASELCSV